MKNRLRGAKCFVSLIKKLQSAAEANASSDQMDSIAKELVEASGRVDMLTKAVECLSPRQAEAIEIPHEDELRFFLPKPG
jgi:hypothetical protein